MNGFVPAPLFPCVGIAGKLILGSGIAGLEDLCIFIYYILLNFTPKRLYQFIFLSVMCEDPDYLTHSSTACVILLFDPFGFSR